MAAAEMSLGIDVGTTSVKVTLMDIKQRKSVFTSKLNHSIESQIIKENVTFSEQDPFVILRKVDECVALCLRNIDLSMMRCITSVRVSGQMHGVVLWLDLDSRFEKCITANDFLEFKNIDKEVTFQSNLITWEDKRCDSEFLRSIPASKSPLHSGYGCATLFWLNKKDKDTVKSSQFAGSIMDFLVWYICALKSPIVSDQVAHSWGYYDHDCMSWQSDLLASRGFPVSLLPDICMAGTSAGMLAGNWHGIEVGTDVKVAMGDFQCAVFSSCADTTTAVMNIGTSSQLAVLLPENVDTEEIIDKYPALHLFPFFNGHQLAVAASLNGGNVLEVFATTLKSWIRDLGITEVDLTSIHNKFKEFCKEGSAYSECSLAVIPTLHGERHCPDQKASVHNIQGDNISLRNIVKQLHVGIVQNLFNMMPVECLKHFGTCQIACTGSLFEDNCYLKQAIECISGFPCIVKRDTDSDFGAALAK